MDELSLHRKNQCHGLKLQSTNASEKICSAQIQKKGHTGAGDASPQLSPWFYLGSLPAESFLLDQLSYMHRETLGDLLRMKHLNMVELIQTCDGIRGLVLAATKEVILPAIAKYEAVVLFKRNATCSKADVPRYVKPLSRKLPMVKPQAVFAVSGAQSRMQEAASFRKPSPVQRVLRLEFQAGDAWTRRGPLRLERPADTNMDERSLLLLSQSLAEESAITADSVFATIVSMLPSERSQVKESEGSHLPHSVTLPCYGKVFVADSRFLSCRVYQMLLDTHLGRLSSIPDLQAKPILKKIASNRHLHSIFMSYVLANFMERAVQNSLELFLGLPQTPHRTGELDEVYEWIYRDGRTPSNNHGAPDSSLWSMSSLEGRELEALKALTDMMVKQAQDGLKCRGSHQKGTASMSKRSRSGLSTTAGKVGLTTVPLVSSDKVDSSPLEKLAHTSQGALPTPASSAMTLPISQTVSDLADDVDDVRKNSSPPVCPEKGLLLCDSDTQVGKLEEDEKKPSSPKVHRIKRFRLFSSKCQNVVTPACLCRSLETNSQTPSLLSRLSAGLSKAFCFK